MLLRQSEEDNSEAHKACWESEEQSPVRSRNHLHGEESTVHDCRACEECSAGCRRTCPRQQSGVAFVTVALSTTYAPVVRQFRKKSQRKCEESSAIQKSASIKMMERVQKETRTARDPKRSTSSVKNGCSVVARTCLAANGTGIY